MTKKKKIIAIVGPSASGKTNLSIYLAKHLNGEIISADSRQIYSEMNIATAKPTNEERSGIIHHCIDAVTPPEEYSVTEFSDCANKAIKIICGKNKIPIVVGGTGLYFRILLENYAPPKVAPNYELRKELEQINTEVLYKELQKIDPEMATKIHFNNKVKIIRALEVCKTLNQTMSESQGIKESEYDVLWIGLNANNREFLYNRANLRVNKMIEDGLLSEFEYLVGKYGMLPIYNSTIGYNELIPYIKKECDLNYSIEKIQQNTRRYIKRQLSWFRANKNINWLNIDELAEEQLCKSALTLCTNFLEIEKN